MDIKTYCKQFMIWTAVLVALVLLVLGLCFGRIIEANIYEEVGKWVVMGLLIICSCEALAYTLSQFCYHGSRWDTTSGKYGKAKTGVWPVKYEIHDGDLKIFDSYAVSKVLFREVLEGIRAKNPDLPLWSHRSMASIRHEWATHVLLYAIGYKRERTADVDINFTHKWYVELAYWVVGTIALAVIK